MPRPLRYDPFVLMSKTVFLQRVQEAVIAGYRHYIQGTIGLRKLPGLVRKFKDYYLVNLDKNARYRRKTSSLGNARLIMRLNENSMVDFILLVSPGEHPAHSLEKLSDIRKTPLAYQEFELIALTLKGRTKPGLTWRLNAETIEAWHQRLHLYTVHYNRIELFRAWYSLYRVPGFAGIRRQVGELVAYWRKQWQQHRGQDACPMSFPHDDLKYRARPGIRKGDDGRFWTTKGFPSSAQLPKLFYVRKQADIGSPLSSLLRKMDAVEETTSIEHYFAVCSLSG